MRAERCWKSRRDSNSRPADVITLDTVGPLHGQGIGEVCCSIQLSYGSSIMSDWCEAAAAARVSNDFDPPPARGDGAPRARRRPATSIDVRDQRELHPHPSGRQPVAPLLSYGPCVVRRRRDVTAGAPSSGSRVRLCSLHHDTPADGAPRCCVYCVFFPDHRLSNSGSIFVGAPGAERFMVPLHRVRSMVGCRTPHLAFGAGGACRTAPIR